MRDGTEEVGGCLGLAGVAPGAALAELRELGASLSKGGRAGHVLDCYWVGSLDFNSLGNKGIFH